MTDEAAERRAWLVDGAALAGLWLVVVALVGVGGDFPLNDDWAYAWSARHFAATGQLRILDWAAPSLVAHVAWGAALIRLFGASYVVLRVGTLAWALVGIELLYALGRLGDLGRARALLLAIAVGLSPWYVDLAFTYMSEIPWLVLLLAAMVALLAMRERPTLGCLVAGCALGVALCMRQLALVVAPAFVLVAAWDVPRDSRRWRTIGLRAIAIGAPVAVAFAAFSAWYFLVHHPTLAYRQTWHEGDQPRWLRRSNVLAAWCYLGCWIAPWAPALAAALWRHRRWRSGLVSAIAALGLARFAEFAWQRHPPGAFTECLHPLFPYLTNVVFVAGAGPITIYETYVGAVELPHGDLYAAGFALTAIAIAGAAILAPWIGDAALRVWRSLGASSVEERARDRARLLVLGVTACYLGFVLATFRVVFDRYLLAAMPGAIWIALDALPARSARGPFPCAALALVAVFSVGATHEYLSWNGARDRAVRDLESQGAGAGDIDGGFEVNAPRHFESYFARTGKLNPQGRGMWWVDGARWRLALSGNAIAGCRDARTYPFWTWPFARPLAIHVLECPTHGLPHAE